MVEAMSEFLDGELIIKKYFPKKDVWSWIKILI
jgi:hypothetical protein